MAERCQINVVQVFINGIMVSVGCRKFSELLYRKPERSLRDHSFINIKKQTLELHVLKKHGTV